MIAENIWLFAYPLKLLGADFRRNVTVIRLASGELVIHSMGSFTPEDVAAINKLGRPGWLVEAMLRHDTFSEEGRAAFPGIPFLAPPGFSARVSFMTEPIVPAPPAWGDELQVIELQGVPIMKECAFFHAPSRTLIVADLVFNFGNRESLWTKMLLIAGVGWKHDPGMSHPFKMAIKDKAAFQRSMETMLRWDFDRVIVGHGDMIECGGKEKLIRTLRTAGF